MIHMITGVVKAQYDQSLAIDIGSIGFLIQVPQASSFHVGATVSLNTYLHWNQEQGPSMFGFASDIERDVFLLIISCSGIGPKIGLAVLAQIGSQSFIRAVQQEDVGALSKVSGIGAKKAEQIIVHLKHKVASLIKLGVQLDDGGDLESWHTIGEVLGSLNYSRTEISSVMKHLRQEYPNTQLPFDQLMRHALSFLSKKP
jgi:holliday junction DNA helicase RuvA